MALGAFAPLPVRLGGTATNGIVASQFKALTGDLAAIRRTAKSARFHVAKSGATVTVTNYVGENGSGAAYAPTATVNGTGDVSLEFANPIWEDELGEMRQIVIRSGRARSTATSREASLELVDNQTVRLRMYGIPGGSLSDESATVTLWFDRSARIGDYGGDPDKVNCTTEGDVPYAWQAYTELQNMRGDAFSRDLSGPVHVEHLALARMLAYSGWRQPEERQNNNAGPARATAKLGYWANVLDVRNSPGDQEWQVRKRCNAKFRLLAGNTAPQINAAFTELLGDSLISIQRLNSEPLSAPPEPTWQPTINPGPALLDLGGGAWSSPTAFVSVVVQQPNATELAEFRLLMDVDYFALADTVLPAWATFGWGTSDGFELDIDQLDLDAL